MAIPCCRHITAGTPSEMSSCTQSPLPAEAVGATAGGLVGVGDCSQGDKPSHISVTSSSPPPSPTLSKLLFEKGIAVPFVCSLLPQRGAFVVH